MPKSKRPDRVDQQRAARLLRAQWKAVVAAAESQPALDFVDDQNTWNTQPGHRQAWQRLLESL